MLKLIFKYTLIFLSIATASLLIAVYTDAAEITVQVDEKELAGALISQIIGQLSQAKDMVFKYIPDDLLERATALGAQMFVLTQQLIGRIWGLIISILQPNNRFGF